MLAYSVFSLRLSEDVPSQSDSVHLISLYLTVCMCYSLLAMTWFAFTNKLREKKRLPHWIRWLALDYVAYVVCATNMHRKAKRTAPPSTSHTRPLPSQHSPLLLPQKNNVNVAEYSNSCYLERDFIPNHHQFPKLIILPKSHTFLSEHHNELSSSQDTSTIFSGRRRRSLTSADLRNEATIWIRRGTANTTHEFIRHQPNGPCDNNTNNQSTSRNKSTLKSSANAVVPISKDKESLYAIHIYNRLVFLIFLLFTFVLNIYTWFFYSRSLPTSLNEKNSKWICFDENILSVVNCTNDK
ncbi:unnamed protein product [Didymodactylos carnosus]|uniref:Neurotransmitter-gated ion-channel transmembrane domain-containing protein n=1 Tax=Didymodactylos carnosus TaxID=1234261 RepID=A0A813VVG1_9BILA|nr:unnamed protein product [Didymodactylos carnosus]CAF0914924.1 unnamed protein product [Didymodactylos carnosus]CAF3636393.1 unnamed protein product [Didymodactylos carnosus]CAF3693387.1 unnamed protein product [Didymodactylos carnosus]